MITDAIRWSDDIVQAFDERGEIVHALCGDYRKIKAKVLAAANQQTAFWHGKMTNELTEKLAGNLHRGRNSKVTKEGW